MTLYAGGITMGHMDLDATLRGADYHAVSTMQTSGVVNAFWQSEIQATSSGKLGAKNFAPCALRQFRHRPCRQETAGLADLSMVPSAPPVCRSGLFHHRL